MTNACAKQLAGPAAIMALALAAPASAAQMPVPASPSASEYSFASPLGDLTAEHRKKKRHGHWDDYDDDDRYYGRQDRRYYGEPVYRDTRIWRGRDGRYYCRRENGTTGLLIGAGVGGLAGNELAGRGDKALGTLLGAVGGAIQGREIDRSTSRCR